MRVYDQHVIGRRAAAAVVALGLAGSQTGHLLTYQLRFGAAAQQLQVSGVHGYFPGLAKTCAGLASLGLLGALFVIGLGRVVTGKRIDPTSAPSLVSLLAVVYTLQLGCFAAQETIEALVGGARIGSVSQILLWGALGQLPVALVASVALRWLLARLGPVVGELRIAFQRPRRGIFLTVAPAAPTFAYAPAIASVLRVRSNPRRGPPSS